MNYKYVLAEVAEKKKSREIPVNPSFQKIRELVASKTLRTFISVKFYVKQICKNGKRKISVSSKTTFATCAPPQQSNASSTSWY